MDISEELEKAKQQRTEIVSRINQMENEKQNLLQEALRIDGEVRILEKLLKANETDK
jgi:uncharacterized protein (UPF0335 family)